MEAKEFRTGNLLNYTTAEGDVMATSLDWQDFKWLEEDRKGFEAVHDYIPLTEDWLIDFGFEYVDIDGDWIYLDSGISLENNVRNKWGIWINDTNYLRHIRFVHQLQNLYFALTGKELTKEEQ